jgi:predicted nucleic acid-binding protein
MDDWVFVDTCVWASFFGKPASVEKAAVDDLLDSDRVAVVGPILTEILLGFRRKEQADWVGSRLKSAHYVDIAWEHWREAAELGRALAAAGHKIPVTDLIVATIAKTSHSWLYTTDPHFDLIPDLKRYQP